MKEIKYYKVGDYYFPNIKVENRNIELSHFGNKLLDYLKQERKARYLSMLAEDTLIDYLNTMDTEMNKQYDILLEQFKIKRGITEELKKNNQLLWMQEMNNIKSCIEEIIYQEYIDI